MSTSVHDRHVRPPVIPAPRPAPDLVGMLVAQALDDLDTARIDVEAALRLVAEIAWRHGHDQAAVF